MTTAERAQRTLREIRSISDLDRGLVVRWEWSEIPSFDEIRKTIRPVGMVITRVEKPFGLYDCKYLIQCLDDENYCFSPKGMFERGRILYA